MDFEQRLRVPDRGFRLADHDPGDHAGLGKKRARERRAADVERLAGGPCSWSSRASMLPVKTGRSSTS